MRSRRFAEIVFLVDPALEVTTYIESIQKFAIRVKRVATENNAKQPLVIEFNRI